MVRCGRWALVVRTALAAGGCGEQAREAGAPGRPSPRQAAAESLRKAATRSCVFVASGTAAFLPAMVAVTRTISRDAAGTALRIL